MKRAIIASFVLLLSSCAFQGPSVSFKPFDTASQSELELLDQQTEQGFKVVGAKLHCLEQGKRLGVKGCEALEAPQDEAK